MQYEKRLISIFTPSVVVDLACLPLEDQKDLAKIRLGLEKRKGGPRRIRGRILSAFLSCASRVLRSCAIISWKAFHFYLALFISKIDAADSVFIIN